MRRTRAVMLLAGALGLGGTASCSDALGIDDILGIWDATSVAGQTLPGHVTLYGLDLDIQYWRWTFETAGECSYALRFAGDLETRNGWYTVDLERKTIAIELNGDYLIEGSIVGSTMTLTGQDDVVVVLRRH